MKRIVALGVAGMAAIALVGSIPRAGAQVTRMGDSYLFRMKYTKGQKMSYDVISSVQVPGGSGTMKMDMPMTMNVKDVQGKTATVQLDVGPMMMNGKPGNVKKQSMEIKLDDRGKTLSGGAPGMQGVSTQLPEKPLKVGETYASSNTVNVMGQQLSVKSVNKFLGIRKVGSRTVAALGTTSTGSGAMKVSGTGTAYVDVADGSLVAMNMNQEMIFTQGGKSQTMKNLVTVTRK